MLMKNCFGAERFNFTVRSKPANYLQAVGPFFKQRRFLYLAIVHNVEQPALNERPKKITYGAPQTGSGKISGVQNVCGADDVHRCVWPKSKYAPFGQSDAGISFNFGPEPRINELDFFRSHRWRCLPANSCRK